MATTRKIISVYKVEPYVMAADVYASPQHKGRGGWTWYTGSAGWMYQLIIESLLGIHLEINKLTLLPRLPKEWTSVTINYRYGKTFYTIIIKQLALGDHRDADNANQSFNNSILLVDDEAEHIVEILVPGKFS